VKRSNPTQRAMIEAALNQLGLDAPTSGVKSWVRKTYDQFIRGTNVSMYRRKMKVARAVESSSTDTSIPPVPKAVPDVTPVVETVSVSMTMSRDEAWSFFRSLIETPKQYKTVETAILTNKLQNALGEW
jgi:hypothetical protein